MKKFDDFKEIKHAAQVLHDAKAKDSGAEAADKWLSEQIAALDRIAKTGDLQTLNILLYVPSLKKHKAKARVETLLKNDFLGFDGSAEYIPGAPIPYLRHAAIADALNKSDAMLKLFCNLKEEALRDDFPDLRDADEQLYAMVRNRTCCGMAAADALIPVIDPGVYTKTYLHDLLKMCDLKFERKVYGTKAAAGWEKDIWESK